MSYHYTPHYYKHQTDGSYRSAKIIVPLVLEYLQPRSVVDFGCGVGNWLAAFQENGVTEVVGLDGDYVDRSQLRIDLKAFVPTDLTLPVQNPRRFDLAMTVDVAEHLPDALADQFVSSLTDAAPVVLFSAAVPHQGGTHHINEQWPDYWVTKFAAQGYEVIDPIRRRIWKNNDVEWWYRQNVLLFVKTSEISHYPALQAARALTFPDQISLVHPSSLSIRTLWHAGPVLLREAIMRKLRRRS